MGDDREVHAPDPARLDDPENWTGGWYGLAIEVGPHHHERLGALRGALWTHAGVRGCYAVESHEPLRHVAVALPTQGGGTVVGTVRLPTGPEVVCGCESAPGSGGRPDWLDFGIPLGALERADPRVGGYPFDAHGASSRWRRPIDGWLAGLALEVFPESPFRLALVGFDVMGEMDAERLAARAYQPNERSGWSAATLPGTSRRPSSPGPAGRVRRSA